MSTFRKFATKFSLKSLTMHEFQSFDSLVNYKYYLSAMGTLGKMDPKRELLTPFGMRAVILGICLARVFFIQGISTLSLFILPQVFKVYLYGHTNLIDLSEINLINDYVPPAKIRRFDSVQAEIKYGITLIFWESFEFVFYSIFVPVQTAGQVSKQGGYFFKNLPYFRSLIICQMIFMFTYKAIYWLEKRKFELKFHLDSIGSWKQISVEDAFINCFARLRGAFRYDFSKDLNSELKRINTLEANKLENKARLFKSLEQINVEPPSAQEVLQFL